MLAQSVVLSFPCFSWNLPLRLRPSLRRFIYYYHNRRLGDFASSFSERSLSGPFGVLASIFAESPVPVSMLCFKSKAPILANSAGRFVAPYFWIAARAALTGASACNNAKHWAFSFFAPERLKAIAQMLIPSTVSSQLNSGRKKARHRGAAAVVANSAAEIVSSLGAPRPAPSS